EAIAEFQAAAKAAPREPNVNFGLGYLCWKLRQYDDARPAFERELSVDPDHAQALAYLGDIEMKSGNLEKAVLSLKKAVQLKADIHIAYADLGAIFMEQKHYPDALAALQRAVKLDPAQPDTHFRLGRLYQAMGNTPAANQEFAKVRELHQKTSEDILEKMSGSPPPLQP
ncbi:MAG TPA: tetratricopeptide repeat protein, partial [Candidatus Acidoferrum sp.]|nr:tetratricopeptide repeat protein [Candidatus Acidoferrum sp.]